MCWAVYFHDKQRVAGQTVGLGGKVLPGSEHAGDPEDLLIQGKGGHTFLQRVHTVCISGASSAMAMFRTSCNAPRLTPPLASWDHCSRCEEGLMWQTFRLCLSRCLALQEIQWKSTIWQEHFWLCLCWEHWHGPQKELGSSCAAL